MEAVRRHAGTRMREACCAWGTPSLVPVSVPFVIIVAGGAGCGLEARGGGGGGAGRRGARPGGGGEEQLAGGDAGEQRLLQLVAAPAGYGQRAGHQGGVSFERRGVAAG